MELYRMYYKVVPIKGYYIASEIAKRAYQHNILENIYPDDDCENFEVTFTKEQLKDIILFNHSIRSDRNGDSPAGFNIYGVDIRRLEGFCKYYGNLHCNPYVPIGKDGFYEESQYICHFLGNQNKIDIVPNAEENSRKVIDILKNKLNTQLSHL